MAPSQAMAVFLVVFCNLPMSGSIASGYRLRETYGGSDFFSKFNFWTNTDPSQGAVDYVSYEDAKAMGLAEVTLDSAIIRADNTESLAEGVGRKSVRIQSRNAYNAGLFVVRIHHAPTGCGVWPAFWMYGEDAEHSWPSWGEYDILEAVHEQTHTRTTLHTDSTCTQEQLIPGEDFDGSWEAGESKPSADICDIDAPLQFFNQGCSQKGPAGSLGADFNVNGGGTFAAEWDPVQGHMRTWFWPAGQEPYELKLKGSTGPNPEMWGKPFSYFGLNSASCPAQHFLNMRLVFNINFCGDLGDGKWELGCPELAAEMTCKEYVARNPHKFTDAYWSVGSVDVYQQEGPFPANLGERIMFDFEGSDQGSKNSVARQVSVVVGGVVSFFGVLGLILVVKVEFARQHRRAGTGEEGWTNSQRSLELVAEEAQAALQAVGEQLQTAMAGVTGAQAPVSPGSPPHLQDPFQPSMSRASHATTASWQGTSPAARSHASSWDSVDPSVALIGPAGHAHINRFAHA